MAKDFRLFAIVLVIYMYADVLQGNIRLKIDVRQFDDIINAYMKQHSVPGASIAVSKNGKILLSKGYGKAGKHSLVTPWSLFRIGSISKVITAIGIMRLYEQGRLHLDDPVFGPNGILKDISLPLSSDTRLLSVTVRHLLHHSGGWDQKVTGDPMLWTGLASTIGITKPVSQHDLISYMMGQKLQFEPGSRFAYSNFGYILLGRVIEQITNVSYSLYITQFLYKIHIYRMHLGHSIQNTRDPSEVTYYSDVAHFQTDDQHNVLSYDEYNFENLDSSAGWVASAPDLLRLLASLNSTHGLLSPYMLKLMLARPAGSRRKAWYGLGFVVQDGGDMWWHGGELPGSTSVLTSTQNGYAWAVLFNRRVRNNDVNDLLKYAIRKSTCVTSLAGNASDIADTTCNRTDNWTKTVPDSVSADQQNLVKLRIPERKIRLVVELFSSHNYRPIWIDASTEHGSVYFNTIWTKNNEGFLWYVFTGINSSKYRRKAKSKHAQGYRQLHVDSYISKRRLVYAAIFVRDFGPVSATYVGHNLRRHKKKFYRFMKRGFRLAVQSITRHRGRLHISAIYDKTAVGEFTVRLGLTTAAYLREFADQVSRGRGLAYVDAYKQRDGVRFSAIWDSRTTPVWAADHGLSRFALLNSLHRYALANVPVRCITSYHRAYRVNYAILWH